MRVGDDTAGFRPTVSNLMYATFPTDPRARVRAMDVGGARVAHVDDDAIALDASVAADVRCVFWFDGSASIGIRAVSDGALPWRPAASGVHLIHVVRRSRPVGRARRGTCSSRGDRFAYVKIGSCPPRRVGR